MTRHSTLTNPNDLHYAKIRTFSGNVANFAPDFIDQLVTATDTNRVYRATGTDAGNLVELLPSVDGDGGSSKVRFFSGIAIAPDNLEQLLIDISTNRVYRAIGLDVGDWLELIGGAMVSLQQFQSVEVLQILSLLKLVSYILILFRGFSGYLFVKGRSMAGSRLAQSLKNYLPHFSIVLAKLSGNIARFFMQI